MDDVLRVDLGARSYVIRFGRDLSAELTREVGRYLAGGRKVVAITDRSVRDALHSRWEGMLPGVPTLALPPGEKTKSLAEYGRVLAFLAEQRLDREGVILAVGGGVIGDLAGFAAASFLRGVGLIQVPTTLLAMVDSSVGGKTGLNLEAGKNLVGAFHQPLGVFVSTDLLGTLPAREFAAGMAEVIKYGLIGDPALFAELEKDPAGPGHPRLAAIIRRCCEAKARVVEADEFERAPSGGRAILNLGHTFGHAIERVTRYETYLHGEAVAVGLAAAARLSERLGNISKDEVERIESVVARHGLPVKLKSPLPLGGLMEAMLLDKKVRTGSPRFVVLKKIGVAATVDAVEPAIVEAVLREVGSA